MRKGWRRRAPGERVTVATAAAGGDSTRRITAARRRASSRWQAAAKPNESAGCTNVAQIGWKVWLGGRDSNPDNLLQSQVSYRWTTSQCQSGAEAGELPIIAVPKLDRQAQRLAPGRRGRRFSLRSSFSTLAARRVVAHSRVIDCLPLFLLLLLPPMARHPALAARLACLFARPLVGRALLMRGFAALAGDLALLTPIHRRKSAIFFCHVTLPPGGSGARVLCTPLCSQDSGCNRYATACRNSQQ